MYIENLNIAEIKSILGLTEDDYIVSCNLITDKNGEANYLAVEHTVYFIDAGYSHVELVYISDFDVRTSNNTSFENSEININQSLNLRKHFTNKYGAVYVEDLEKDLDKTPNHPHF